MRKTYEISVAITLAARVKYTLTLCHYRYMDHIINRMHKDSHSSRDMAITPSFYDTRIIVIDPERFGLAS